MKKLLTLSVMCLAAITALAQKDIILLDYEYTNTSPEKKKIFDYRLHTSAEKSLFYNTTSLRMDSISRYDGGSSSNAEMASVMMDKAQGEDAPKRTANIFVDKSFPDNSMRVYDDYNDQFGFYDESLDEMQWEICDSVKIVLDYECTLAETDYHGRHWKVWFTTEIPLQDGPWKLHGLPGLILSAEDSTGSHRFEAIGIARTETPVPPMYRSDFYSKEDRKAFLKSKRKYIDDPVAYILQSYGLPVTAEVKVLDHNGNEMDAKKITDPSLDFLETDYK